MQHPKVHLRQLFALVRPEKSQLNGTEVSLYSTYPVCRVWWLKDLVGVMKKRAGRRRDVQGSSKS
jgi:hypothetical protein